MANSKGSVSKSKYSAAQKKAYYSGMGYRAACEGKRIPFKNDNNLQSFREGYKAAGASVSKYPQRDTKKGKK